MSPSLSTVFLFVFLWGGQLVRAADDDHTPMPDLTGCRGSDEAVVAAINASANYNLSQIVVNCLGYKDSNSTISLGVVSYKHTDGSEGRYIVECVDGLLVLKDSVENFLSDTYSCHQCIDATQPCVSGTNCSNMCKFCYGANETECVLCEHARYNGICMDACPRGRYPNRANGNNCECPKNYVGENCTECDLSHCESGLLRDQASCTCKTCPSGYFQSLVDPNSTVPESVIGEPGEHHEHKRETEGGGSHGETKEITECVRRCPNGWRIDSKGICYACGHSYCLECTRNSCTKCREGTLLSGPASGKICEGFYDVIRELYEHLEEEEEEERNALDRQKLELKIALPIVCFLVIVIFVALGVIAHFRYPHVGHEKRHRNPQKKAKNDEIEKKFRPRSTVIYR